jgi:circadian clock protein KaiC
MVRSSEKEPGLPKVTTGILGLDVISKGGLPRGGCTLVEGGAGSGKSILALQSLVHAAGDLDEASIFVAFEESAESIVANAATFGWDLPRLQRDRLFFLDAQPSYDLVISGSFDLGGMLAALDTKIAEIGAKRIVFDALDIVTSLLNNLEDERREVNRLHKWIRDRNLTTIITLKSGQTDFSRRSESFTQFMVDCAIRLSHRTVGGVSQRCLQIVKFRGSSFDENEASMIIGYSGLQVAHFQTTSRAPVTEERVSSGIGRLDTMLGGGYFRGASVLITGSPGTAKTTLCAAFAEAACLRGESTVFVSFDSDTLEVVRNVRSVGIDLGRYMSDGTRTGLLQVVYGRSLIGNAENHLMAIRNLAGKCQARCVVLDPISILSKFSGADTPNSAIERLIDWAKTEGVTLICSSLLDETSLDVESTPLHVSTLADTWIYLSYLVSSGERNRGLTVIKSRGSAHSNQVRELVLSDEGVTLADAYTADGAVLMGTLRWEREQADETARQLRERAVRQESLELLAEEANLAGRVSALQFQLDAKRARLRAIDTDLEEARTATTNHRAERLSRRHADDTSQHPAPKATG